MIKLLDEGIFSKNNAKKAKVNRKSNFINSVRLLMEMSVNIDTMLPDVSEISDEEYEDIADALNLVKKRIDKVLYRFKR